MPNYPIVKDLIVDLTGLFEKHEKESEFFNGELFAAENIQFLQTVAELNSFLQFSYCIKCGLCLAACPTCATDEKFLGPQSITQAYRYSVDSRDEGFDERSKIADDTHGIWNCHLAGACSDACPKGVDPAFAIQKLKGAIVSSYFSKAKKEKAVQADPVDYSIKPADGVAKAPEKTVK